jgi:2,4-dienoyl-CoA reductase-like NADH-dependent reductase (Old Yellow Enzyme family)
LIASASKQGFIHDNPDQQPIDRKAIVSTRVRCFQYRLQQARKPGFQVMVAQYIHMLGAFFARIDYSSFPQNTEMVRHRRLGNIVVKGIEADLIAYGIPFLANPDLTERIKHNAPLNSPDFDVLYTPGAKGYNDYPLLALG